MKSAAQEKHPAYAGKATSISCWSVQTLETSRIRGESRFSASRTVFARETSPHTRGKPHVHQGCPMSRSSRSRSWRKPRTCIGGVTGNRKHPAYAGKAPEIMEGALIFRKHPRIRGESPLTPVILYLLRKHPAYAGKAQPQGAQRSTTEKHPAYAGKAYQTRQWQKGSEKHPAYAGKA